MLIRCLAIAALTVLLPRVGLCGGTMSANPALGAEELRRDVFARAAWKPEASTFRLGGSSVSVGLAAGPSAGVRSLSGNDVQAMFPMLSMRLSPSAELALIPRSGRGGSGAMLALQISAF